MKVQPGDPNRCQHSDRSKQCSQPALQGFDRCRTHVPSVILRADEQRQYTLGRMEDRAALAKFAEHESIKSLRDEIGLARMLVEKRFNLIQNDTDLIAHCAPINQLLLTIEKLVKTCHTMEQSLGSLLARGTVLQLGKRLCEIIVDELQGLPGYEAAIDNLIQKLVPALTQNGKTHVSEVQTELH